jgi:hypothetical protein
VRVEVASNAEHQAAVPAHRLAEGTDDAGAAGAVEGVEVGPRLHEEGLAEAEHTGAAICVWVGAWSAMRTKLHSCVH